MSQGLFRGRDSRPDGLGFGELEEDVEVDVSLGRDQISVLLSHFEVQRKVVTFLVLQLFKPNGRRPQQRIAFAYINSTFDRIVDWVRSILKECIDRMVLAASMIGWVDRLYNLKMGLY